MHARGTSNAGWPWSKVTLVWTLAVVAVAVVVVWPAVGVRYFADDTLQLAKLDGHFGACNPGGLYAFFPGDPAQVAAHIERGTLPWWTVAEFRFVHLRPLASVLLWLDHAIAPRAVVAHHLHSVAWLVAMLVAAMALLRRTSSVGIAAVALLVLSLDETLAWTVAWLANRCALIAATFVFVAMAAHIRRTGAPDNRRWFVLELSAWVLAVGAGEYAVCGMGYLAAYALIGRRDGWRARARALVPAGLALAGFAVAYAAVGAGVAGGTSYIDPFTEPARFLHTVLERTSRAAGEVWLCIPGETEGLWNRYYDTPLPKLLVLWNRSRTTTSLEQAHGRFAFGSVAIVVGLLWWLMRRYLTPAERRAVGWTAVGSLLSLVPLSATPPVTRTLTLAGLGPAVLLGSAAVAGVRAWRQIRGASAGAVVQAALLTLLGGPLLAHHTINDARWSRKQIDKLAGIGVAFERFFASKSVRTAELAGKHVVVLAAPDLVSAFYGPWIVNALGGTVPASWHTLAMGPRRYIVRRHRGNRLELSALGEAMHATVQEMLFRGPEARLGKGAAIDAGLFVATVVQELPGQGPSAIMFAFSVPLDDPSMMLLVAGPDGLEPFTLPKPGEAVALPKPEVPHDAALDAPG